MVLAVLTNISVTWLSVLDVVGSGYTGSECIYRPSDSSLQTGLVWCNNYYKYVREYFPIRQFDHSFSNRKSCRHSVSWYPRR